MSDQNADEVKPEEYLSEDPSQQQVAGTDAAMDSLGSYEDGGDMDGGKALSNEMVSEPKPGTGSAATDELSNNGNSVA